MAFDRFVAICHPLRYMLVISPNVCVSLVMAAWLMGCLEATILTSFTFQLTYCGPYQVNYFFCDIPAVLSLACADSSLAQKVGSINWLSGFNFFVPCLCLLNMHWDGHFENPFSRRQAESYLYMQCLPHCNLLCL